MKSAVPLVALSLSIFGYACISASAGVRIGGRSGQDGRAPSSLRSGPEDKLIFDRDVRPILSDHCFKCHGPAAGSGAAGLRLDTFIGATAKLDEGIAIVPGNPSASVLLKKVTDPNPNLRMPPPGAGVPALTADQVHILTDWIARGAKYEKHWAFIPPQMPAIPKVSNPAWCKNLIDRYVLAKLDSEGLKPEPEADEYALALRAAQTLTGLAPTPEELNAYLNDKKPDAYERYVDRLIAKPEYGEQEARYWLDAVRYGDTHGLQLDNERGIYPYRDWVIQAFNRDLPYDKFVKWQLAGDLLPKPTTQQLVATGYVRMNLTSDEGGAIPAEFLARNTFDRVDTTGTALLGLTVGCAKCHDHKFDPISQKDYYGLYAYFDSTQDEPLDGNVLLPPPFIRASTPAQEARLASMDASLERLSIAVDPAKAAAWLTANRPVEPSNRAWGESPVYTSSNFDEAFDKAEPGEPGQAHIQWQPINFQLDKEETNLIKRELSSIYIRGTINVPSARAITLRVSSDDAIRLWLNGKLIHSHKIARSLGSDPDVVQADFKAGDNELIAKLINNTGDDGLNIRARDANGELIDKTLADYSKMPKDASVEDEVRKTYLLAGPETPDALAFRKISKQREALEDAIPMTLVAKEMDQPRPTFVLQRGQYDQPGARVERHIPPAIGTLPVGVPNNRLGLADWITSPGNPLLARVMVNRLWQQHFGVGLVKSSEDFGSQGEWPENQALLDYLAVSFAKHGWSMKALNRLIVTSAAFRQSSRISAAKLAKDPENRLVSRGPRFRLDAEVIRDKALEVGGLLVEQLGGRGFKPFQPKGLWENSSDPASGTHVYVQDHGAQIYRRSIYMFWKRTSPPPVMVTFDAPLRDTCIVRRSETNTPLQALAMLNETGFLEASRAMAARILAGDGISSTDQGRIQLAYELALCRPPKPFEISLLEKALRLYREKYKADVQSAKELLDVGESPQSKTIDPAEQAAWMLICSTIMNTDEFITQH